MTDDTQAARMRYPELPVDLPQNAAPAEYGSDAIAGVLSDMDFDYAFIVPGSSFRGLHDSLVNHTRNHRPELVLCTHEAVAVAMAHGYAKATGRPALCIVHDLVGLMMGSMSAYNAWCDRTPIVMLGGSGPADPSKRRFMDWTHTANTQAGLIRPFIKWTDEPPTLPATLESLVKARKIATSAPTGPVYVSIDQGVQEQKVPAGLAVPDVTLPGHQAPPPTAANPEALERAADMLLAARLPLVIGGRFGLDPATTVPLVRLVELLGAAYDDDRQIVCLPTDHKQSLTDDPDIRGEADVVIGIDCVDMTMVTGGYGGSRRADQRVIEMSFEHVVPNVWSNFGGPDAVVDLQITCDPMQGLRGLTEIVAARLDGDAGLRGRIEDRKRTLAARHAALRAAQRESLKGLAGQTPIHVSEMITALHEAVRGKGWTLTARSYRGFPGGAWEFGGAGEFLGGDGGGGVGYGTGAAVGGAIGRKAGGKPSVAIVGDGDFVMGSGAVWTAVHYRVPLLMVIQNNTSWGNDEQHQQNVARQRGRPLKNAWIGQRMVDPDIDFASIARGYGAWAEGPVTDPAKLPEVYRRAVAEVEAGRVAVVDVRTAL